MELININPIDAAWLYVEKSAAPAHFGPLLFFTPPKSDNDFVQRLVSEWRQTRQFSPPFNYRIAKGLIPRWEVLADEQMDMEYHFFHSSLPKPGGEQELGILISRLHSHPLDRAKPLWQCYVIEGLEGGRFAIYLKLHHSQMDGMGAAKLMQRTFSLDPDQREMRAPWAIGLGKKARSSKPGPTTFEKSVFKALGHRKSQLKAVTSALRKLSKDAYFTKEHSLFAPYQGPKSVLNRRISPHRRYATQHLRLDDVKAVADAAGVKINDVFLAITGAALRKYLEEYAQLPAKPLVGQIPVNLRAKDDDSVGNSLSFIYASLGTDIVAPLKRLQAVHASTESSKLLQQDLDRESKDAYTAIVLSPYITEAILGLGGYLRPAANLVISNVFGPKERAYFNGARIDNIYGPSVLFHGQALNITMSSYVDEINIGYTACRDALPSMQKIAVYTGEAFKELAEALDCKIE